MTTRKLILALLLLALAAAGAPGTASAFPDPDCFPPTISGTARVGETLTANQSTCSAVPAPSYSWSWSRCDSTSGPCTPVGSGQSHTLGVADHGKYMRVVRTASNGIPPDDEDQAFSGRVKGRPPSASFTFSPIFPTAGDTVTFTSTSKDPDGDPLTYAWDLDGDGVFDDGNASQVRLAYANAGTYTVTLRVTADGETSTAFFSITVSPPPSSTTPRKGKLRLLRPFPVVAIGGFLTARGVRLTLLAVRAPRTSKVLVRCYGRGCPRRTSRRRVGRKGVVVLRSFRRRFKAGAVIKVYVWKKQRIGKYTRFGIRRGRRPSRRDRCIEPVKLRRVRCP